MTHGLPDELLCEVAAEVARTESLYPTWPENVVEQAAIVVEEAGELLRAANSIRHQQGPETVAELRREAVQTAAMAVRFLMHMRP